MTKIELNGKVEKYFKLLNTKEKCEFLAYFPETGITQKQLADAKVFNMNRSVVHYHIRPYRKEFLKVAKKADAEGYKPIFLTDDGQDLQGVARYMILVDDEINQDLEKKTDLLGLFFEKGSPIKLLDVFNKIYSNGISQVTDFHRFLRDRHIDKMVKRLESFGLIEVIQEKTNRQRRYTDRTELGELFGEFFILPIVNHINGVNETSELLLYLNENNRWSSYVKKNGQGWFSRVTKF